MGEKKIYIYREWDEKTQNTGVEIIDNHHKKYVEIINNLVDLLNQNKFKLEILDIFHKLLNLAESYFIDEELFYKTHNYKSLTLHKQQHAEFVHKIQYFHDEYKKGESVCENMMKFLDRWFKEHILKEDVEAVKSIK
jgi:hemerythrin